MKQKSTKEGEKEMSGPEITPPQLPVPSPEQADEEKHGSKDPNTLTTVQSNSPPYSIFSKRQKQFIVFLAAWGGFFSPLSAHIYFPALPTLSREYHVSDTLTNLTLMSYMIFQGLAPTFFGDLADMAGRRPAYIIGFIIYIGANVGLALQKSYAALFVLRCIQSTGSSPTIALGNGIVADIATSSERGVWMGLVTSGPMVAPAIAPVIGGLLSQYLSWRAIFWFLVIMAAVYLIIFTVAFPETGRAVVGNGSVPPQGWNMSLLNYLALRKMRKSGSALGRVSTIEDRRSELAQKRKLRFPNPLGTLRVIGQKDAGLLLFYNSLIFTAYVLMLTATPYQFRQIYGFDDLKVGLCFIAPGAGAMIAPLCVGKLMDWNYRRVAKQIGFTIDRKRGDNLRHFPLERVRLMMSIPFLTVGSIAMLCFGWVLEVKTSLAAPLVLMFIMGVCITSAFSCMSIMVVDYYPMSPSTATAANNLIRCLMGAGGAAAITPMINAMGIGWCFTFVTGVIVLFSPILWVLLKWGPQWREERRVKMEERNNL